MLIGLDWGTSTLRAYRFAADGAVDERLELPAGVATVADRAFRDTFERACARWLRDAPDARVVACGMVGSRQGWREADYLSTPTDATQLAGHVLRIDALAGRPFAIVPGVATTDAQGVRDVMRGEETQVFGALDAATDDATDDATNAATDDAPGDALLVLPGTHSKWVRVRAHRIERFRTYLTGELFATLSRHSILGRLFPAEAPRDADGADRDAGAGGRDAFALGVARAAADPAALPALLFSVRTEGLFAAIEAAALPDYLSGLLIGAEVAHAIGASRSSGDGVHSVHGGDAEDGDGDAASGARDEILIVAAPALASRYAQALAQFGARCRVAAGEPAAAALARIGARVFDRAPG